MAPRPQRAAALGAAEDMEAPRGMSARPSRAKSLRIDDGKSRVARATREYLQRGDTSQEQLAIAFETQQPNVSRWGLDHEPHAPSSAKLAREEAPREYVRTVLCAIADVHHLHVSDAGTVQHGDNHALRTLHVTTETTDVMRAWAVALADNHLSDAELADIQREVREAIDALRESDAYVTAEISRRAKERLGG